MDTNFPPGRVPVLVSLDDLYACRRELNFALKVIESEIESREHEIGLPRQDQKQQ